MAALSRLERSPRRARGCFWEPGEVAPSGRYEGKALRYGSAMLVLFDEDLGPGASALEPLRALKARLPELRALGATSATLYLVVAYERQCDFELSPEDPALHRSTALQSF